MATDVACGTGVLFPYYIERGASQVVGVDISPAMAKIAAEKFRSCSQIEVVCSDVLDLSFDEKFDCIVLYNAFPHFPHPAELLSFLVKMLKPGGRLTVAHGMSRAKIDAHHKGSAKKVSIGLMHEDCLAEMLGEFLKVDTKISDNEKYIVAGQL